MAERTPLVLIGGRPTLLPNGDTLPIATATQAGVVPASGGGTANFLRADGTWAAPAGGGGGGAPQVIAWVI